jgi:hypothetical protein
VRLCDRVSGHPARPLRTAISLRNCDGRTGRIQGTKEKAPPHPAMPSSPPALELGMALSKRNISVTCTGRILVKDQPASLSRPHPLCRHTNNIHAGSTKVYCFNNYMAQGTAVLLSLEWTMLGRGTGPVADDRRPEVRGAGGRPRRGRRGLKPNPSTSGDAEYWRETSSWGLGAGSRKSGAGARLIAPRQNQTLHAPDAVSRASGK